MGSLHCISSSSRSTRGEGKVCSSFNSGLKTKMRWKLIEVQGIKVKYEVVGMFNNRVDCLGFGPNRIRGSLILIFGPWSFSLDPWSVILTLMCWQGRLLGFGPDRESEWGGGAAWEFRFFSSHESFCTALKTFKILPPSCFSWHFCSFIDSLPLSI